MKRWCAWVIPALSFLLPSICPAQSIPRVVAGEREGVDLTVYNEEASLIREVRAIALTKGLNRVIVLDVPATIDPTSLQVSGTGGRLSPQIVEQNYEYDLVNQPTLLEKYIGRNVEFVRESKDAKGETRAVGKLLSTSAGMVAEIDGKIEINPIGHMVLPSLPEGLVLKPQLEWLVSSDAAGTGKIECSYLAGRISWSGDYVVLLHKDDAAIDLTAWVTLNNHSGTSFKNAGLKLVGGDVNMVRSGQGNVRYGNVVTNAAISAPAQFKQTNLFEYKLYALQRRTDINNNETKQVQFASAVNVPAHREMAFDGLQGQWQWHANNAAFRAQAAPWQEPNAKVSVWLVVKNRTNAGLGIALPKGRVRVYKNDDEGKEQFVGEDVIDHTPKDEDVRLLLGNAFDVVGDRVQTDFKGMLDTGHAVEETIEIRLRNHKSESVTVLVEEHPWRWFNWQIKEANAKWEKKDQGTIVFPAIVGADEEKLVRYTIRYHW